LALFRTGHGSSGMSGDNGRPGDAQWAQDLDYDGGMTLWDYLSRHA
jgi:hypothetical protein